MLKKASFMKGNVGPRRNTGWKNQGNPKILTYNLVLIDKTGEVSFATILFLRTMEKMSRALLSWNYLEHVNRSVIYGACLVPWVNFTGYTHSLSCRRGERQCIMFVALGDFSLEETYLEFCADKYMECN